MNFGAFVCPLRWHANFKYLSVFVYVFFLRGVERESIASSDGQKVTPKPRRIIAVEGISSNYRQTL